MLSKQSPAEILAEEWKTSPRWKGIHRPYKSAEVARLQGSLRIEYTLAETGAKKLWKLFSDNALVRSLGAMSGCQAVQMVQAGLQAIYLSGWQIAADANDGDETYPDLSLYPVNSIPRLIRRINKALQRADQIQHLHAKDKIDYFVPLIADAEAGFGGVLNTFELVKAMITSGVAAIHLEDQLSSLKKCGHMGGKVLVSTENFIEKLIAARLAADVMGVPTLIIGRTDAESALYLQTEEDPIDKQFLTGKRSSEGYFEVKAGIEYAIARGCAYSPYSDLIWCETSKPDLGEAREFAQGIHEKFPGKWLAYNCSPSFNWQKHHRESKLEDFQEKLAELGYKFQFVTLAGFHTLNASMYDLANRYAKDGMSAYAHFQHEEFELEKTGYKALKHQSFVGASYFDAILSTATQGQASTHALKGSTEEQQFI